MGQYKQDFAALWGAGLLADGSFDVSGVVSVIAAIGLGRLIAFPIAGPLSDRFGRRLSGLIGCGLYAVFFLGITYAPNLYAGYALAAVSGMANSFLDTSITPSCMEIFKEKGAIANIFTKLSISIAQFLLPFAIRTVAARNLPFHTIFLAAAAIIVVDALLLAVLPFPPFVPAARKKEPAEKLRLTPASMVLVLLGFTTSTTFMLWMNCNQELGTLYGLADSSRAQSFYSIGIVAALFVNAALLARKVKPTSILIVYPTAALVSLGAIFLIQKPMMVLSGGLLIGFFGAGGVLQLVVAVANELFPKHRGVITSIVMIASSVTLCMISESATVFPKNKKPTVCPRSVDVQLLRHKRHVADDIRAFVDAQRTGVEAQIVVLRFAPVAVGVVLVVDLALAVFFLQTLLRGLLRLAVQAHNALGAMLHIGMDENMQRVRTVLEDEVRTAADDDAGTLFRQVADDVGLADVELVGNGHRVDQTHRVGRDRDIEQEAAGDGGVFTDFLDELVREAAFLCYLIDQLLVIVGNSELLGDFFANGSAAAAELPADGDHFVCHG